jgi:hypothetical protein
MGGCVREAEATLIYSHFLVLPGRIELTTSPLPRGCSTTELRQQEPGARHKRGPEAAGNCHKGWRGARIVRPRPRIVLPSCGPGEIACGAGVAGDGSQGPAFGTTAALPRPKSAERTHDVLPSNSPKDDILRTRARGDTV